MVQPPKILVVEDDPEMLEILTLNLEASGYVVVTATDGYEALQKFDEEKPDLVTLDLAMPTITGFRLLRLFKSSNATVPVIVLTAFSFEEAEEVARLGAVDFITKPVDFPDLYLKMERALNLRGQTAPRRDP
ncbi:MAG: response regulator [Dehalococcoidia bacterium]|nr:response regulator [Dehalococcoidia bacterium]